MATFDTSFLNPKLRKSSSQDYGFLVDQLDILRNRLESDGKLSPGDYDLLTKEAQKIYAHPGLTPAQRSNVEVKISSYQKDKTVDTIKTGTDLSKLNRDVKSDQSRIVMSISNDPQKFLKAQVDLQAAKIDAISASIDHIEGSGDDASAHYLELEQAKKDYEDAYQAFSDVSTYKGGDPTSNYGAYMITNGKGEIVDVKVGRIGSQSGYLPTKALYGGLPIYGKANRPDESGRNTFVLGNDTFTESTNLVSGPDGVTQQKVLVPSGSGVRCGYTQNAGYVNINPAAVRPQGIAIPDGAWAEGNKGVLYNKKPDGSYTKYVNGDRIKLGIADGSVATLPQEFEQQIIPLVNNTVDGAASAVLPVPSVVTQASTTPQPSLSTTTPPGEPASSGRPNTGGAPTVRAPQTAQGTAQSLISKAGSFLGKLFGQ